MDGECGANCGCCALDCLGPSGGSAQCSAGVQLALRMDITAGRIDNLGGLLSIDVADRCIAG